MESNFNYSKITFTNQNSNYEFFYKSMKETMINISNETNLFKCQKILSSFISNFLYGVVEEEYKERIENDLIKINNDIINDYEIQKIIKYDENKINVALEYTQKYYEYYTRLASLFGLFLEGLNQTLMPNTTASNKKVRYSNNNHFFITYPQVKQDISENLSSFRIDYFTRTVNGIIIFYYAYRSYVTKNERENIEFILNGLVEFVTDKDFLRLVGKEFKTTKDKEVLDILQMRLYKIIIKVYGLLNEEHSIYDLNPKIEKRVYIDKTGM